MGEARGQGLLKKLEDREYIGKDRRNGSSAGGPGGQVVVRVTWRTGGSGRGRRTGGSGRGRRTGG